MHEALPSAQRIEASKEVKALLRSPEEVRELSENREKGYIFLHIKEGEYEINLLGFQHTLDAEKIEQIKQQITNEQPELMLHESEIVLTEGKTDFSNITTPEEAVRIGGEQGYLAWVAHQMGMSVKSWDIPIAQWLQHGASKYSSKEMQLFLAAQAAKIMLESGMPQTSEQLAKLIEPYVSKKESATEEKESPDILSSMDIEQEFKERTGKTLSELSVDDLESLTSPYGDGPTNHFIRDINQIRDEHAVDVITEAGQSHKKIFVSAGLDHVLTWEPALRAMYASKHK